MMWTHFLPTMTLVVSLAMTVEPARFLAFFHLPSPSLHFLYRPVMEALAAKGHQVVYVTAFPYEKVPEGIQQIALPRYDYEEEFDTTFAEIGRMSTISLVKELYRIGGGAGMMSLPTKQVQDLIHSETLKFDAILFEPCFGQEYLSAFLHKFNAIGIEIISLGDNSWTNELAGLPDNTAFQRDVISKLPGDMSFWQRLHNTYQTMVSTLLGYYYLRNLQQPFMDKYFNYTGWESRPPIEVLARNRSLILVNYNHLLGYPYPVPPHRKDIGGINIRPTKTLPKDIQQFMNDSKHGVIYMSFGSHVKAFKAPKQIGFFLDVFKNLPQRVLLKFETDYPGKVPPNVKISKWYPQQDILAHNNCILFVSHGGLLSTTEAAYHGVPILGVPFFADQHKNVLYAEEMGFGKLLTLEELSQETASRAVKEVLSNKRYKEVATKWSKMFKEIFSRHTPTEDAVYWIEHSLKHPFALTPKTASMSAIQLHLIDVKLFILLLLVLALCTIYTLMRFITKNLTELLHKKKIKVN